MSITPNSPADFTPTLGTYNTPGAFRFWCQKVLPLVYDDSLSYYELLCKVVEYLNQTMEDVNTAAEDITNLHTAYEQLQEYVNSYFDSLDVQEEINNKLDAMVADGTFDDLLSPYMQHYQDELNLMKARLTNLETAYPSGGTAADAELADIRVSYDGTIYSTAGDAVRAQVSELADTLEELSYAYYIVKPPECIAKYYFNKEQGTFSASASRLTYYGGICTRGAVAYDLEIGAAYKWNAYYATMDGSYTYRSMEHDGWIEGSKYLIPIPSNANRIYVVFAKIDGTDFTDNEVMNVFNVRLVGAKEKEVYPYNKNTDFESNYYGNYQYVTGTPQIVYTRLTCERFYEIEDEVIIIAPKSGYKCNINLFDEDLIRLGNTGSWITTRQVKYLKINYSGAKYFKITYAPTTDRTMDSDDYNAFTVYGVHLTSIIPTFNTVSLDYADWYANNCGDIAIYGDYLVYAADHTELSLNGTIISGGQLGHGNNLMFGKTLYNDFPKLYAGGWYTWNKCVFVNAITTSSFELIDTITFSALPDGYVNMCVDEENERFYIFEETGEDTHVGDILFAVCDFSGNVISTKSLDIAIPIIQGTDFVDGFCYITAGNGSATYPNVLLVFDTAGNLVSKTMITNFSEVEGLAITSDKIYIKFIQSLYSLDVKK